MDRIDVLDGAAEWIEAVGWTQGGTGLGKDGSVCAVKAMQCMTFGHPMTYFDSDVYPTDMDVLYVNSRRVFAAYVDRPEYHDLDMVVARWNDTPERTAEEVTFALRACALRLETEDVLNKNIEVKETINA